MTHVNVKGKIAGRDLILETGNWAKQSDGSIIATYGGTKVMAMANRAKAREGLDFFPLTVDYRERTYAAGKYPGGFFKREARPTNKETLTCRLIDRPIRPLFPDGYKEEVQVLITVIQYDGEIDPDVVGMVAAFAALRTSSIPFTENLGAVRVGYLDEKVIVNPSIEQTESEDNQLNLVMAATKDAVQMVEAGANQVSEAVILDALEAGQKVCGEIGAMIDKLAKKVKKPKLEFQAPEVRTDLDKKVERKFYKKLFAAVTSKGNKHERGAAIDEVATAIKEWGEIEFAKSETIDADTKYLKNLIHDLKKRAERETILEGTRTDGRGTSDIRPISCEVGPLERLHGSSIFTRGETQALVTTTLGTVDDEQIVEGLGDGIRKKFYLHYNFPPFCVGEVRPQRGPGRREIGHGMLAERALVSVLPDPSVFPYTIRLVSEILESNGSSSMASVCGGCLSLMDAGVPIQQPVAGIAMGLIKEGRKTAILSDILGSEDHCGDMDFKVTGTQFGITALQMDIKCSGLTRALMKKALEQAKQGRIHILKEMLKAIDRPRTSISKNAPRLERLKINPEKIGLIIGPGGKNIRALQEETKTKLNVDDDGTITIAGAVSELVDEAVRRIEAMTAEVEIGKTYQGRVVSIKEFGAFIEVLPGQEGLCHVSELSNDFVRSVNEVVDIGDVVAVKVLDVDALGKIKLSRKVLLEGGDSGENADEDRPRRAPRRDDREAPARGRGRERSHEDRPRRSRNRDEEEAPRRGRSRRDEEGNTDRSRHHRDDEDRPRRSSRSRDDEDRPRRSSRSRDDEDRPRRSSRSRDDEDRPRQSSRSRDDEDRPRQSSQSRDDEVRSRRSSRSRDDEDRSRRSTRSRDDEDRPRRSRADRDDEDRPRRGRGRDSDRDESWESQEDRPRARQGDEDADEIPRNRDREGGREHSSSGSRGGRRSGSSGRRTRR